MTEELITIGKITKHQGNKGEVKVIPLTDFLDRFELLDKVFLSKGAELKEVSIESWRYHKNFIILKFEGCDDIGAANQYRDFLIKISREEAILPPEHYYLHDILGLEVLSTTGEVLGKVVDILETGSNDVYVVQQEEEEYLIPALKDVVQEIDLEKEEMRIKLVKGLI
ncbi:ribosome maturation factor RimM [Fuchsiella alkaliacetigena]|uniref:ribosome maturation factor RimM n=1 Tax=Fuchsiella alkaliacetigena TaxID=957042 RepID=UPI00200A7652|nr:ribosome maturation factor RimM [Fuchsiella alkaliacetigena]MCK8825856.1 ribosome maturation factor RimM [Fuchsiella alkaliacetigena]